MKRLSSIRQPYLKDCIHQGQFNRRLKEFLLTHLYFRMKGILPLQSSHYRDSNIIQYVLLHQHFLLSIPCIGKSRTTQNEQSHQQQNRLISGDELLLVCWTIQQHPSVRQYAQWRFRLHIKHLMQKLIILRMNTWLVLVSLSPKHGFSSTAQLFVSSISWSVFHCPMRSMLFRSYEPSPLLLW